MIDNDIDRDLVYLLMLMRSKAMSVTLQLYSFDVGSHKDKANKLAEEACEAFSAWEDFTHTTDDNPVYLEHLCSECIDVIQAAVNLMMSCGATQEDINKAIVNVTKHNILRGRYSPK